MIYHLILDRMISQTKQLFSSWSNLVVNNHLRFCGFCKKITTVCPEIGPVCCVC